ncbi:hypothetical protein D9M69_603930 [compost metagenome]
MQFKPVLGPYPGCKRLSVGRRRIRLRNELSLGEPRQKGLRAWARIVDVREHTWRRALHNPTAAVKEHPALTREVVERGAAVSNALLRFVPVLGNVLCAAQILQ